MSLALAACRPGPSSTAVITATLPIATPAGTPTAAPLPSNTLPPPTATPSPQPTNTATPTATLTPTPTATPTLAPLSQQILIEDAPTGGDGGDIYTFYLGRAMPSFILYMDGRLLVAEVEQGDDPDTATHHYNETSLTATEMCALLQAVQATGFLTVEGGSGFIYAQEDPIYEFGDFSDFSEGAPFEVITVNGPIPKQVQVYAPYWSYVVAEVDAMSALLRRYATRATSLYQPERVVLWIEKGRPPWLAESVAAEPWPEGLPPLSQLVAAAGDDHRLLVEDEVGPLLAAVDYRMRNSVFLEAGETYWVIVRQLLPHETPDDIPSFSGEPQQLPLPFDCSL